MFFKTLLNHIRGWKHKKISNFPISKKYTNLVSLDLHVTTSSVVPTIYVELNKTNGKENEIQNVKDSEFRISCTVKSSPRANVSFTRLAETLVASTENGITINTSEQGDIVTYTLTLRKITYRQAGEYFCRASNGADKKNVIVGTIQIAGL